MSSLHNRKIARAQRVCRFSVENEAECFARIEEERRYSTQQSFRETNGEILRVDCKLLTYPTKWHKDEKPLESAEDCRHLQKSVSPSEEAYAAMIARQDYLRPSVLLAGEKCYEAALDKNEPPYKDPKDPASYSGLSDDYTSDQGHAQDLSPQERADLFLEGANTLKTGMNTPATRPPGADAFITAHLFETSGSELQSPSMRTVHVQGTGLVSYSYKQGIAPLNCADPIGYSHEIPIAYPISVILLGYPDHADYQICVVGRSKYSWQPMERATVHTWSSETTQGLTEPFSMNVDRSGAVSPANYTIFSERAAIEYNLVMRNPKSTPEQKCIARQKLQAAQELDERHLNLKNEESTHTKP